jgi:hypothetical protein
MLLRTLSGSTDRACRCLSSKVHSGVRTQNEQEPDAPAQNQNKSDGLVWQTRLSGFIRTDDSQVRRRASMRCSSSGQAHLDGGEVWTMTTLEVEAMAKRCNR